MTHSQDNFTDFGYQTVSTAEKADKVAAVFHSVARKYDVMNDLMSLGIHRLWKRYALATANVKAGHQVMDLAGGTGDLAVELAQRVGPSGRVVLVDINASMLSLGRDRLLNRGLIEPVEYVQADAEHLPFPNNSFDLVTMAFGLRNVTQKEAALREITRVLTPGGKVIILEFSQVTVPGLAALYDAYSFQVLPWLGKVVADDEASYRYLAESIRRHPNQPTLKAMMETAGLAQCNYENLCGGIVALHKGYKY